MAYAIEVRDLVKTYPGKVKALDGLTLAVEPGTVFGLLGPNGAGKSTTIRVLNTLSRADSGTAVVDGVDVTQQPEEVRMRIGCVPQKSGVDPEATGRENLELQGQIHGMRGRELARRVDELLERFGLASAAQRMARTFSGGMQRKLDVALGLVHRPRVLFLDEPTTGLDPEARAAMWGDITNLAQDGITVLLTTHYLEEADKLSRKVAIIDRGRVVAEGTPEELKSELRGDAIQIELVKAAEDGEVRKVLEKLDSVGEIAVEGRALRARADHGATAVPTILASLEAAGFGVASVRVARPTLDDVYLRHAGRTFEQAEKGGAQ